MADVLDLQDDDPVTPAEQKQSGVSYALCHRSSTSQLLCIRW